MERLRRDAETGWTAESDAALLVELRALSGRILARVAETSSAVDALVSEGARCEVRVRDACTRFRQLEDTAHVEYRVPACDAEDARLRRGSSAASSSSLEEDVPESSRVESRYREALRVTIRTTRGKWLLPAPLEGVTAGDDGARDETSSDSREPLGHAGAREEGVARDGPAPVGSREASGALPPPQLVGNRFWRPLPHVIGTRQFYHDENVTADWSPALAPDEYTAKAVTRGGDSGGASEASVSGDEAEEAKAAESRGRNAAGAAAFATYAWDPRARFFGNRSALEDGSDDVGSASDDDDDDDDDDAVTAYAEEEGTTFYRRATTRGAAFGDHLEDGRETESERADDEDDLFGDPFAAAARHGRSRFADTSRDDGSSASSFSSASVMAASERTQKARGSPARGDKKKTFGFGGGRIRPRREREGTETDEARGARDGAGRTTPSVAPRASGSSPRRAARVAAVDFVAMTEAALRDPGVARAARPRGGLFDDDDVLPGPPAARHRGGASVVQALGDTGNASAFRGKNGATGVGLFDDEEEKDSTFDENATAAPATAASAFATRGLFESDDESDADDEGYP